MKNTKLFCVVGCGVFLILLVIIVLVVLAIPKLSNTKTGTNPGNKVSNADTSSSNLYSCLKTASSGVEGVSGMISKLVVSSEKELDWGQQYTDNGTRTFNLAEFKDFSKQEDNKIYFYQMKNDKSLYVTYPMSVQICSEDNKTVFGGNIPDENRNHWSERESNTPSLSSVTEVSFIHAPEKTGKYRIDGFLFVNNKWVLVDRINVQFN